LKRPVKSADAKDSTQRKIWRAEIEALLRHLLV
jgi:hypothetical protein